MPLDLSASDALRRSPFVQVKNLEDMLEATSFGKAFDTMKVEENTEALRKDK